MAAPLTEIVALPVWHVAVAACLPALLALVAGVSLGRMLERFK